MARLNLSHGSYEEHQGRLDRVREAAKESGKAVAILVDLQGPKIRLARFENGPHELFRGDIFTITTDEVPGTKERVGTTYKGLPGDCKPGDFIMIDGQSRHVLSYLGDFLFSPQRARTPVKALSGGERARLLLAKLFSKPANLLVLDEPTNDLDVETLRALEEALESFAGCAVVISHDRFFLDRLATHILAFEGDSHVEWFEGNFEAYEEDKHRRMGAAADRPHALTYKRLTR